MKLIYVFMVTTNNRVFTLSPVYILLDQKGIGSDVIQLVERLMVYIILYVAVLPNSNILLGQECLPCIKKCSLAYNNTSLETTVHCSQYHKQSEYNYVQLMLYTYSSKDSCKGSLYTQKVSTLKNRSVCSALNTITLQGLIRL